MLSTRTARRAHMTELTRVGLTCRAFARAGSKGGSHDRAHTGAGSHAGHSFPITQKKNLYPRMLGLYHQHYSVGYNVGLVIL